MNSDLSQRSIDKPEILSVNCSKIFYHPLQGEDQFIRTGTIGDGSCLIHSLFHAYSEEYSKLDQEKKITLVKKFRKDLAKELSIDDWKLLNNGIIALITFQEYYLNTLNEIYKNIKNKTRIRSNIIKNIYEQIEYEKNSKYYDAIFSVIDISDIDEILCKSNSDNENKTSDVDMCIRRIINNFYIFLNGKLEESDLNRDKIDFFNSKFKKLIEISCNDILNVCYNNYINELKDSENFLDQSHIELISEKFNFDIYFIDGNTRLPYFTGTNIKNFKNRKTVFILWINENHYEIIGRVIKGTNKVTRKFEPNDPFVVMINMLYTNPKKFSIRYPKYVHFLPKDIRRDLGLEN